MINFLTKISQSKSILDVTLLTPQGDLLFYRHHTNPESINREQISNWCDIIWSFNELGQADFHFTDAHCFIQATGIGYLIIGMTDTTKLKEVKAACQNVHKKLSKPQQCKNVLLKMLANAPLPFKPDIIKSLIVHMDNDVAITITELLHEERTYTYESQATLLLVACQALGHTATKEAKDCLETLLSKHANKEITLPSSVTQAAKLSLTQLSRTKPNTSATPSPAPPSPQRTEQQSFQHSNLPKGSQIITLAQEGQKQAAVDLAMQCINACAQRKQFDQADQYRDLLMEADPSALSSIIQAAELLEDAKKSAISADYFSTWESLAEKLSSDTFVSLYHAMQHHNYPNGSTIVEAGQRLSTLFFIESGQVQLYAISSNGTLPIATLSEGEIFGAENFFEKSIWTVKAVSLGTQISLFSQEKFHKFEKRHPEILVILRDYCSKFPTTSVLTRQANRTRRAFPRKKASGTNLFTILDKAGTEEHTSGKGTLLDISKGGLSFSLHAAQKDHATSLFGREIMVAFIDDSGNHAYECSGTIIAVQVFNLLGKEYSIHINCDKTIDLSKIRQIGGYEIAY